MAAVGLLSEQRKAVTPSLRHELKTTVSIMKTKYLLVPLLLCLLAKINATPLAVMSECGAMYGMGGAYLTFAGKFGGELQPHEIRRVTQVSIAGCAAGSTIKGYLLQVHCQGQVSTFESDSGTLSPEALKYLALLEPGDSFDFEDVTAQLPSGDIVQVLARRFVVI